MIDYLHTRMGKEKEEKERQGYSLPNPPPLLYSPFLRSIDMSEKSKDGLRDLQLEITQHILRLFDISVLCVLVVLEWESTTYAKDVMFPPRPELLMTSRETESNLR